MAPGGTARGQGEGSCVTFPASLQGGGSRCRSPLQAVSLPLESGFHGISWLVSTGFLEEKGCGGSWFAACCCAPPPPHQHPLLGRQEEQEKPLQGLWPQRDTPAPNLRWERAGARLMESVFPLSASPIPSAGALPHQGTRHSTRAVHGYLSRAAHSSNRSLPLTFGFFLLPRICTHSQTVERGSWDW